MYAVWNNGWDKSNSFKYYFMKGLEFNISAWNFWVVLFFSAMASDSVQIDLFDDRVLLTNVKWTWSKAVYIYQSREEMLSQNNKRL